MNLLTEFRSTYGLNFLVYRAKCLSYLLIYIARTDWLYLFFYQLCSQHWVWLFRGNAFLVKFDLLTQHQVPSIYIHEATTFPRISASTLQIKRFTAKKRIALKELIFVKVEFHDFYDFWLISRKSFHAKIIGKLLIRGIHEIKFLQNFEISELQKSILAKISYIFHW